MAARRHKAGAASSTVAVLALLVALAIPSDASEFEGPKWPRGRIPYYYDASSGNPSAVRHAIAEWNTSGAKIRFVRVPRSRALVIVQHLREQPCGTGRATVGYYTYPPGDDRAEEYVGHVNLPVSDPSRFGCDRFSMARVAAHEFGHVIGFGHEYDGCSLMQDVLNFSTSQCAQPPKDWMYRCRLIEPSDVRGAVRRYGGKVKPVRKPANCEMYPAMTPPSDLQIVSVEPPSGNGSQGTVEIEFRRPEAADIPPVLAGRFRAEGFEVSLGEPDCSEMTDYSLEQPVWYTPKQWDGAVGSIQTYSLPLAPGTHCIGVTALDALWRPSAYATTVVEMPSPPAPSKEIVD